MKELVFRSGSLEFQSGPLRAALVPQFGPRRFRTFLDAGGDPGELSDPDPRMLAERLRITRNEARRLARRLREEPVEAVLDETARLGARAIVWGDPEYPSGLKRLSDPPPALFVRGELPGPRDRTAAMVGSRKASAYGLRMARTLATDLVRAGFTVVSGLARGIDAAAHEAVLAAEGRTIAVLGSGLARPYPPEHTDLLERVAASGAVISEFPHEAPPMRANFPRRNRLVAALSEAVLVVEAGRRSGALTTARHAADLGVEVLAVPGPVDQEQSLGTLALLRDGAAPLASVQDLFVALGFCDPARLDLPDAEQSALGAITPSGSTVCEVAVRLGWEDEIAAGYLVTLEVRGIVERESGGRYVVR